MFNFWRVTFEMSDGTTEVVDTNRATDKTTANIFACERMIGQRRLYRRILSTEQIVNHSCINCGSYCPSGTLDNGKCNYCDLIGQTILVRWGRFGYQDCLVQKVSKNCRLYASRWNKKQQAWTTPRPLTYYKGWIWK